MLPFEVIDPPLEVDVAVDAGTLRASWMESQLGPEPLRIADPLDVSAGSLEIEFSSFPQEEGTVLTARWEDQAGALVSAFVDGDEFLVSYTAAPDEGNPEPTTLSLATTAHDGRTRLRMRSEGDSIVVEAADRGGFETLAVLEAVDNPASETAFDRTEVDARLVFDRYQALGSATSIALESVTSCSAAD